MTRALPGSLCLLLALSACKATESETTVAGAASAASATVRWVHPRVPQGDLGVFEAPAQVVAGPQGRAAVSPPVRVQIQSVLVRAGDRVLAGQPVATVLAPDLVLAAAVRQSAALRIAAHQKHLAGLRSLRGEGLMRTADVFQVEVQLADLLAARADAEARLHGAGLTDAELPGLLASGLWTLRAPIAGVVREVAMEAGAVVEPGQSVLARVEGPQPARVEVRLHHSLPAEARLALLLPDGTELPLQATPSATSVDPDDGSTLAWFDSDPPQPLHAGTRGRLRITGLPADVLQVPVRALLQVGGGAHVLVRVGEVTHRRPVTVLAVAGALALVRGVRRSDEIAAQADLVTDVPDLGPGATDAAESAGGSR